MVWGELLDELANSTPTQWLLGRGLFADWLLSAQNIGLTNGDAHNAHNEFIHLLFNQGLLGVGLYVALWVATLRKVRTPGLPQWALGSGAVASAAALSRSRRVTCRRARSSMPRAASRTTANSREGVMYR